jgi:transglutaminase-like putative cysteine protease
MTSPPSPGSPSPASPAAPARIARPAAAAARTGYDGPSWAPPRPTAPRPQRPPTQSRATAERTLSRGRRLASLVPAAGLAASAGYGFHRVFTTSALAPVVPVAVLVPMALSLALSGALRKKQAAKAPPLWPSLLLTVVLWVLVVCATLFRDRGGPLPRGEVVRSVWSALLDAPHAVLTTILPVPDDAGLLVLVHAVVWLAAFASAELALRTRTVLLPAVPAVLAFGVPLVLGVDGPGSNVPAAVALVVCAALLVLTRSHAAPPNLRGLAVAVPLVAVLALLAGLVGPHAPGTAAPLDLRRDVTPPTRHPQSTSPLDEIGAWMVNPGTQLFTVRASSAANWRLAVLDHYDGAKWTSAAHLARSGGRVPAERGADPGRRRTVRQTVTVQHLPGIWLPAADRPTSIHLVKGSRALSVDPDSGEVATDANGAVGARANAGLVYRAVSETPLYDDAARLQYAPTADAPADVALPETDAGGQPIPSLKTFREYAQQATKGSSYPYQQAVKLADWLRRNYRFDPRAIPGHTYRNLEFFLTTGKRGTSEQFAASFAVMARTLNLPTRVAVGFRPGTAVGGGVRQVTGGDALAWPEVDFKGIGWVPFYPTPDKASAAGSSVAPAGQSKERRKVDEEIAHKPRTSTPPKKHGTAAGPGRTGGHGLPVWVYPPAAVLLLLLGYVLYALWLPRRRRSRRRRAPDSGGRVLGAWEQIVERLTEIGLPATSAHTATEVAAFGSRRVGGAAGEHLPALARLVNEVGYGGRTPDTASADAAWAHCDAIERVVVRSVSRRERIRRTFHPRAVYPRAVHPRALHRR